MSETGRADTEQAGNGKGVSPLNGQPVPDGFERHPERRHNGAWKKEETARYKLERILAMSREELDEATASNDNFSGTVATIMIRLRDAATAEKIKPLEIEAVVRSFERIINQVYGTPKQAVDVTSGGAAITGVKVVFEEAGKDEPRNTTT